MYSLHGGIQNDKYIKANSYGFNPIVFYTITDHKSIIGQKIKKKSEVSYYSLLACDQNKDHNTKVWWTFSTVARPSVYHRSNGKVCRAFKLFLNIATTPAVTSSVWSIPGLS